MPRLHVVSAFVTAGVLSAVDAVVVAVVIHAFEVAARS